MSLNIKLNDTYHIEAVLVGKNGEKLGKMGENGEEFRGEFGFISPRNFPFPHFSPKMTVVTNNM